MPDNGPSGATDHRPTKGRYGPFAETQVKAISVQPGDTIVISHPKLLTSDQARLLRDQARRIWPDNEVAILADGIEMEIRNAR